MSRLHTVVIAMTNPATACWCLAETSLHPPGTVRNPSTSGVYQSSSLTKRHAKHFKVGEHQTFQMPCKKTTLTRAYEGQGC
jgi:hypothetical protein